MATFWRLLGFLRPYRGGVIASFVLAVSRWRRGSRFGFLVGVTVDEIRQGGTDLWPLALAVVGAGVLRVVFSVLRRLVAAGLAGGRVRPAQPHVPAPALAGARLLRLPADRAAHVFATVDLQAVRFFLGYGLIFILQAALTILIAATVMFVLDPKLAAVSLAPMPFVIWVAFRYGRRNRPASVEVQQRIAELTAAAEENIGGVRVVKAFAQEDRQLKHFRYVVRRVFDQSMVSTRLRAFYSPFIGFLPQLGLAALLLVGGKQVIDNQISVGEFVAFYGYVLMLTRHADARHRARDGSARRGERPARLRAPRPRAAPHLRSGRARPAERRRARRCAASASPTRTESRC